MLRVVDGLGADHDWVVDSTRASRSVGTRVGLDPTSQRVPDQVAALASSRTVEALAVRRLKPVAPAAFSRSLGIER